jgi:hypothetical protein
VNTEAVKLKQPVIERFSAVYPVEIGEVMASADRTSARWFRQYKILQLANVNNELTSSPVSTCTPESANPSDAPNTKPGTLIQRRRELISLNFLFFRSRITFPIFMFLNKENKIKVLL